MRGPPRLDRNPSVGEAATWGRFAPVPAPPSRVLDRRRGRCSRADVDRVREAKRAGRARSLDHDAAVADQGRQQRRFVVEQLAEGRRVRHCRLGADVGEALPRLHLRRHLRRGSWNRAGTAGGVPFGARASDPISISIPPIPCSPRAGVSGKNGERRFPVTPGRPALPARMCGNAVPASNMKSIWPVLTSATAGAPPLWHACVARMPACRSNGSPARCGVAPMPAKA